VGTIPAVAIGNNAITSSMLATGSVSGVHLAAGAAAASLAASGQSAVPGGGMILSSNYSDPRLLSAGYLRVGKTEMGDSWELRLDTDQPLERNEHTAVWSGREVLFWGGGVYSHMGTRDCYNTGGMYNPAAKTWVPITSVEAPTARDQHSAVWTGEEMLIWGGVRDGAFLDDGGRYVVKERAWRSMYSPGPSRRAAHTAVWTGSEMLVWGGKSASGMLATGGRYNPLENRWQAIATQEAPSARFRHTAIWTGKEMIVWGGASSPDAAILLDSGAAYSPQANSWRTLNSTGAPTPRSAHSAVWTGTRMLIWGGWNDVGHGINTGGIYDPASDTWTPMTTSLSVSRRGGHQAVWTGTEMLICSGAVNGTTWVSDAWRYDPAADIWMPISNNGIPAPRLKCPYVWTGNEMIVWGATLIPDGLYSYYPSRTLYLFMRP
jgi:N-acetylneuraminic acid mutarotase